MIANEDKEKFNPIFRKPDQPEAKPLTDWDRYVARKTAEDIERRRRAHVEESSLSIYERARLRR